MKTLKKAILVTAGSAALALLLAIAQAPTVSACEKPSPVCGNKIVESGEQCDDGNKNDNDTCSNKCQKQIIKEVIKEVPVEKIVEKEVEKIVEVTKEVPVEVEKIVEKEVKVEVEKIVYKDKKDHDKDKDHKKKDKVKAKVLPVTGVPIAGLAGITFGTAALYALGKRFFKK